MAPRKPAPRKRRTTRTQSKRSTGRSTGRSGASVVTVGAIVVIGAAALWATSQNKSPTASVSQLISSTLSSSSAPRSQNITVSKPAQQAAARPQVRETVATTPVARPQIAVQTPRIETKSAAATTIIVAPAAKPAVAPQQAAPQKAAPSRNTTLALVPIAKPVPDDHSRHASGAFKIPKVVIAKQALVIREKAWEQAKTIGSVPKGREMRTYAKVGRWHRVVVPSTNIIGWVQEEQLAFKNPQSQNSRLRSAMAKAPNFTTGSISPRAERKPEPAPAAQKKPQNTGLIAPLYPQQPVGKQ